MCEQVPLPTIVQLPQIIPVSIFSLVLLECLKCLWNVIAKCGLVPLPLMIVPKPLCPTTPSYGRRLSAFASVDLWRMDFSSDWRKSLILWISSALRPAGVQAVMICRQFGWILSQVLLRSSGPSGSTFPNAIDSGGKSGLFHSWSILDPHRVRTVRRWFRGC